MTTTDQLPSGQVTFLFTDIQGSTQLMGMGRAYAARGRTDAAVRLLAHNVGLAENPYADLAQQALDELSDEATEELRAAGGEMTLEEAIALASSE